MTSAAGNPDLAAALRAAGVTTVDDSTLGRSLYATDASLYRVPPQLVVLPRDAEEIIATHSVCRAAGVPLTMRGAGTSIAGNAIGPGVVVDVSRHLTKILEIDPQAGTALVQPGVVHAQLQRAVTPGGWRFGPDPSTHNRCTIGGMIGNNACGSRALGYGRTSDNILGLDVLSGTGDRLWLGQVPVTDLNVKESPIVQQLAQVVHQNLATIRTEFGQFGRQVSGYSLEHLLPEALVPTPGLDLARMLVGTEGTLALTLAARVRLVHDAPVRVLVALGYPNMAEAADAVPAVLPHHPIACEGLDARIVDVIRDRRGAAAVPELPRGQGWLFVELAGAALTQVRAAAQALVADAQAVDAMIVTDPRQAAALWKIREDGAGLSGRTPAGDPAHSGWEDAAVPPERLGAYLREFDQLMQQHAVTGLPYGHFGDGCLHIRIDFPFDKKRGNSVFRGFLLDAATLVAKYGGSMSGEHGDGRARGELLPLMYSPAAIKAFEQVKAVFDPQDLLNPGVIVRPAALDADLRLAQAAPYRKNLGLAYRHDRGDLSMAVHRCTGVGKCRSTAAAEPGQVMCPSFLATKNEKDSTRGRARVLQDAVSGQLGRNPWGSPAVQDALDLCLACKGCASDCPTGVDLASYKAEALFQRYRRRLRPRSHYVLGWLPRVAKVVSWVPILGKVINALGRAPWTHSLLTWTAGVDNRRTLPTFTGQTFRRWFSKQELADIGHHGEVILFVDTFTDAFSPQVGQAAVKVLTHAGYRVRITEKPGCCGLTWISTGQLTGARRQLSTTVRALADEVRQGTLIVGLEPSCTAVLRGDATELLADEDLRAAQDVAAATRTLAEILHQTPGWVPPDLSAERFVAQPHCHHHAVMGWSVDAALLRAAGAQFDQVGGCCGLAGNFGVERGHHEISVAVANTQLLPAVAKLAPGGQVLADGFSCRTQLADLSDHPGVHLAEVLARYLP